MWILVSTVLHGGFVSTAEQETGMLASLKTPDCIGSNGSLEILRRQFHG